MSRADVQSNLLSFHITRQNKPLKISNGMTRANFRLAIFRRIPRYYLCMHVSSLAKIQCVYLYTSSLRFSIGMVRKQIKSDDERPARALMLRGEACEQIVFQREKKFILLKRTRLILAERAIDQLSYGVCFGFGL